MPIDGNYSNWNWVDQSQDNWMIKSGNRWLQIQPPFSASTSKTPALSQIYLDKDYTKEKGWVLVNAQFDGTYPYFILYNKYKSILRTFIHTGNAIVLNGLLTILEIPDPIRQTKLFNSYETLQIPVNSNEISEISSISVLDSDVGTNSWSVADFVMSFDPKVSELNDVYFTIKYCAVNDMSISMTIKGTSTPVPVSSLSTFVGTKSTVSNSNSGLSAKYAKVHKTIKSIDEGFNSMQKSADKIKDDAWKPLVEYKKIIQKTAKLGSYLNAAASLSSGIGAVMSFFDFFTGSSSSPMGYYLELEANGSINFRQNIRTDNIHIPGVNYTRETIPSWKYNQPMGLLALSNSFNQISTTDYVNAYNPNASQVYEKDQNFWWKKKPKYARIQEFIGYEEYPLISIDRGWPKDNIYLAKYLYKRWYGNYRNCILYNFSVNNVDLLVQDIPGINISSDDITFAIIFERNSNYIGNYSLNNTVIDVIEFIECNKNGRSITNSFSKFTTQSHYISNPLSQGFSSNNLIIHKFNENNDYHEFGTQYVKGKDLKGKTFRIECPVGFTPYLHCLVRYYIPGDKNPQLYKTKYKFNMQTQKVQYSYLLDESPAKDFAFADQINTQNVNVRYVAQKKNLTRSFSPMLQNINEDRLFSVEIYNQNAILCYSSKILTNQFDISKLSLSKGLYFIIKRYEDGETIKEKIYLQ